MSKLKIHVYPLYSISVIRLIYHFDIHQKNKTNKQTKCRIKSSGHFVVFPHVILVITVCSLVCTYREVKFSLISYQFPACFSYGSYTLCTIRYVFHTMGYVFHPIRYVSHTIRCVSRTIRCASYTVRYGFRTVRYASRTILYASDTIRKSHASLTLYMCSIAFQGLYINIVYTDHTGQSNVKL